MSSTQNSSSDILSLPNEVLAKICHEVALLSQEQERPIIHLRLVCKHFYAPATESFAKHLLRKPYVMMSKYSLQTLVEICKNPLFGPHIRVIDFQGYRQRPDPGWQSKKKAVSAAFVEDDLDMLERGRDLLDNWLKFLEEEYEMATGGGGLQLLTEAFKFLRTYGNTISFQMTAQSCSCRLPIGHRDDSKRFPPNQTLIPVMRDWSMDALGNMLEAAAASECNVSGISLEFDAFHFKSNETIPDSPSVVILNADILSCIPKIRLYIDKGSLEDRICGKYGLQERMMPLLTSLKEFSLRSDHPGSYPDYPGRLLMSLGSEALHQISLEEVYVEAIDLIRVLKRHESTLRRLDLLSIVLCGSWVEVLRYIGDTIFLDSLSIESTRTFAGAAHPLYQPYYREDWMSGIMRFRGKDEIRVGIDTLLDKKMIQEMEGTETGGW